ncbi:hypothetical protein K502DRAFT_364354 [Neoconidiobolus thromboides FSU 785]|nr:hypothetical protein K502DRAFT_364354 [Neoconidiobolus thromboides FSU 785]
MSLLLLQYFQSLNSILKNGFILLNLLNCWMFTSLLVTTPLTLFQNLSLDNSVILIFQLILVALLVLSFIGIYSVKKEDKSLLFGYIISLNLLIFIQLVIIVWFYQDNNILDKLWNYLYQRDNPIILELENRLSCCGYENVFDRPIPLYCHIQYRYSQGCKSPIQQLIRKNWRMLVHILGSIFIYELVLIILATFIILFYFYKQNRLNRYQLLINQQNNGVNGGIYQTFYIE